MIMFDSNCDKPKVVVSLTSFPPAISYATEAIKSILRGSALPDKIVLYLALPDFGDSGLPDELLELVEQNGVLEIRNHVPDLRSYMKLVPALADFPEDIIVTIDDDVYYHKDMLRDLLKWHDRYPDVVLAHRTRKIKPGCPYREWPKFKKWHFLLKKNRASYDVLLTGVGGVLYPPHALKQNMIDPDLFAKLAPTTDDIWFWAAAVANGTKVMPVPFGRNKTKDLNKSRDISLRTVNYQTAEDRNVKALDTVLANFPDVAARLGWQIE